MAECLDRKKAATSRAVSPKKSAPQNQFLRGEAAKRPKRTPMKMWAKSIEGDRAMVSINEGRGGKVESFPLTHFLARDRQHRYTPEVDDRVLLCIDEDSGKIWLVKLRKTRQDSVQRTDD